MAEFIPLKKSSPDDGNPSIPVSINQKPETMPPMNRTWIDSELTPVPNTVNPARLINPTATPIITMNPLVPEVEKAKYAPLVERSEPTVAVLRVMNVLAGRNTGQPAEPL
jgi:hypothetical protein